MHAIRDIDIDDAGIAEIGYWIAPWGTAKEPPRLPLIRFLRTR